MNEYTEYMLGKCIYDKNETKLHNKVESLAQMCLLNLINVKTFISEIQVALEQWVIEMIPKQNYEDIHETVDYMIRKLDKGGDFIPKEGIIFKEPIDAKDNFFKHLAILFGVDFTWLSFKIYAHYREVEKNGNK